MSVVEPVRDKDEMQQPWERGVEVVEEEELELEEEEEEEESTTEVELSGSSGSLSALSLVSSSSAELRQALEQIEAGWRASETAEPFTASSQQSTPSAKVESSPQPESQPVAPWLEALGGARLEPEREQLLRLLWEAGPARSAQDDPVVALLARLRPHRSLIAWTSAGVLGVAFAGLAGLFLHLLHLI